MKFCSAEQQAFQKIEQDLWFFLWFSLPLNLKLTSLVLVLLFACVTVQSMLFRSINLHRSYLVGLPFFLFFTWQASEIFTTDNKRLQLKEVEQTLSLVAIPAIFILSSTGRRAFADIAFRGLITALLPCSLYALGRAFLLVLNDGDPSHLFYHQLASPWHPGAVYFSLYLLFPLFMAGTSSWMQKRPMIRKGSLIFLFLMLLLMASKLMILCGVPLLLWQNRSRLPVFLRLSKYWMAVVLFVIVIASIPLFIRILPLVNQVPGMIKTEDFRRYPEPNGLQLRAIFLRFGMEILHENNAWWRGTGMAASQALLDKKIAANHMYLGTGIGTDTGYLYYNFHNQYLETLVRQGIVGLLLLCVILLVPFLKDKDGLRPLFMVCLLLPLFFLTESVLERQAGIIFFCLLYGAWVLKYP
jgi:hypothetical protein